MKKALLVCLALGVATPSFSGTSPECTDVWGGQLCRIPGWIVGSFGEYRFADSGGTVASSAPIIERLKVRCGYKAKTFFVDDALRTKEEIFAGCMRSELWIAGH